MAKYERRWNGWGSASSEFVSHLSRSAREALALLAGEATALPDADFAEVVRRVPASRLPPHDLISSDAGDRLMHARGQSLPDWLALRSGEIGVFPDAVAFPEDSGQVRRLLAFAAENDVALIPYGGGTSVVGHINPLPGKRPVLTVDMGRMNRLLELNAESLIATFGAGVRGPHLEAQLGQQGYTLGHFPQSWEFSTLGGWVASRSSGQQSLRYGRIEQMFAGARVETPAGTLEIPSIPASSAGPDIREMIMGSEGRMGILTEVNVRVMPLAEKETFHVAFLPDWETGVGVVREMAQQKQQLSMLRLSNLMETITLMHGGDDAEAMSALNTLLKTHGLGDTKVMLTFAVTGSRMQHQFALDQVNATLLRYGGVDAGEEMGKGWARNRFGAPYLRETLWQAGYAVDTMETALNWDKVIQGVAAIETAIRQVAERCGSRVHVYTHLSHVYGQGCSVYTTYIFACAGSYAATLALWQQLKAAGAAATVMQGGTISHQHGVGRDHKHYLSAEKGALGIHAIGQLCRLFDPDARMNPGKLLPDEAEEQP